MKFENERPALDTSDANEAIDENKIIEEIGKSRDYLYRTLSDKVPHDVIDDVIHDALARAMANVDEFKAGEGNVKFWVYRIAMNGYLDRVRRSKLPFHTPQSYIPGIHSSQVLPEFAPSYSDWRDPIEIIHWKEQLEKADEAMGQLNDRQRKFLGMYVDGLSCPEIAKKEGVSLATVQSVIKKAREIMREYLESKGDTMVLSS